MLSPNSKHKSPPLSSTRGARIDNAVQSHYICVEINKGEIVSKKLLLEVIDKVKNSDKVGFRSKLLYVFMCREATKDEYDGSRDEMADLIHLEPTSDLRTIDRIIKELKDAGWIRRKRNGNKPATTQLLFK